MLEVLGTLAVPYQLVVTKCDRFPPRNRAADVLDAMKKVRSQAALDQHTQPGLGEIIAVGGLDATPAPEGTRGSGGPFGVEALQWSILKAAGLDGFAMEKAGSNVATESTGTSDRIGWEAVTGKSETHDDGRPEPSPKDPTPALTLEEFMAEVLGRPVSTRKEPRQSASLPLDNTEIKDKPSSNLQTTSRNQADRTSMKVLGALSAISAPHVERESRRRPAPSRPSTTKGAIRGADSFDAMFARIPAQSSGGMAAMQSGLSQKGVSQGADAFAAMLGPETANKNRNKTPARNQSRGRTHQRGGQSRRAPEPKPDHARESGFAGKGVAQGIDAFSAMFAQNPKAKAKKRR
jgi:hypothetical protein